MYVNYLNYNFEPNPLLSFQFFVIINQTEKKGLLELKFVMSKNKKSMDGRGQLTGMYIISLLRLTITKILFEFIESKKGKNTVNSITREEKVEEYCKLRVFLIYRKKEKQKEKRKRNLTQLRFFIYIYIYNSSRSRVTFAN